MTLRLRHLLSLSLLILAALLGVSPYSTDLASAPPPKSPGTLEVKAQETVEKAGYTDAPADRASWF